MPQDPNLMNERVTELVAIGAAIAASCEPCFRHHYDLASKLGVSKADMRQAVAVAANVKTAPHRKVMETADRYLEEKAPAPGGCACGASGCC